MIFKIDAIDDPELIELVREALKEDQSPPTWEPPVSDDFMVVQYGVFDRFGIGGVIILLRQNGVMWDAHVIFKREFYGKALSSCRFVMADMFKRQDCLKIKVEIPTTNALAISLAKRAGFKLLGINERSIMKGGNLLDLAVFTKGV